MYVRVQVKYDVETVAQVIAPILDYDPSLLARALRAGPVLDGPYSQDDAISLASALRHFGVSCAFEPFQSLGQLPAVSAMNGENAAGRYVYSSTSGPADRTPPHGKTGIGQ